MARTEHGTNLAEGLVLQPGSSFERSRSGADTGSRTFKCDASVAEFLAPRRGDPDSEFPNMFAETVTIEYGKAGIAMITVSYKGALDVSGSTGATENNIVYDVSADFDAIVTSTGIKFTKFTPSVTHTYATTEEPTTNIGDYVDPPMFADKVPSAEMVVPVGTVSGTWQVTYSQAGWRIQHRNIKVTGGSKEVSDTYVYSYYISILTHIATDGSSTQFVFSPPV